MTYEKLMQEMEDKLKVPGLTNSWTYPIRGRIDMLLTGIRTPLGIKLYGDNLDKLQQIATKIEKTLSKMPQTLSVFADRVAQGYYLYIDIDKKKLARYGLTTDDILTTIQTAVGGMPISTIYKGLERYPLLVRFPYDYRKDIKALENLIISTPLNEGILLKNIAKVYYKEAPSVIKSEKGMKVVFIYITPQPNITPEEYVSKAKKVLANLNIPPGYFMEWAGQSQYLEHAKERLKYIIPLTVIIIFLLVYITFKDFANTLIVMLSLPFATLGGLWYLDYLNFNMSIAVIVGFLALLGVAAETAIVMVIYLEEAVKSRISKYGKITKDTFFSAVYEGAVLRVRPKMMTVSTILAGLIPLMYITGVGSEVMQRIAAPMIGGVISSAVLTLVVIPAIYSVVKFWKLKKGKVLI
jgi:Cu(I)/Ag(I) efflux system membrane protein CusA/SilA